MSSPPQVEDEPLLSRHLAPTTSEDNKWLTRKQKLAAHVREWKAVYFIALFIFVSDIGDQIRTAPEVQLLEELVCRRHFQTHDPNVIDPNGNVPAQLCKIDIVQSRLVTLIGWLSSARGIVQLIVVLPFGVLADTKGRRLVITLSQLSLVVADIWLVLVCYFHNLLSYHMIWLMAVSLFFGGGSPVLNTVLFATVTDVTTLEKRTKAFFYVSTVNLVVEFIGPPIGAGVMLNGGVYVAAILGIALEFSSLSIVLWIPESLHPISEEQISETESVRRMQAEETPAKTQMSFRYWSNLMSKLRDLFLTHPCVSCAIPAFLTNRLGRQLMAWMLQYVSKRLNWSYAVTSIFLSIRPIVNIVLFAIALPWLNHSLTQRFKFSPPRANLLVAKWSLCLLILGCLIMGLLQQLSTLIVGLIIFACGWGFSNNIQLLASSGMEPDQIATLYSALSFMDAIGGLLGPPALALTYSTGLSLGGIYSGLPFFLAAVAYGLTGGGIWFLNAPRDG